MPRSAPRKTPENAKERSGRPPDSAATGDIVPHLTIRRDPGDFRSLTEYVTSTLKDTILSRALPPGTRLTEQALAGALGVSRLPVREALKTLSSAGLVDQRPHGRGAVVSKPSKQMLAEVYQVRAALELLSTELAAEYIADAEVEALRINVRHGRKAVKARDWARAAELGSEFHRLVAKAARNAHLAELIESYDEKLRWANEPVSVDRGIVIWKEHGEIVEALANRNRKAAVACMRSHTDKSSYSISQHGKEEERGADAMPVLLRCV
jgi:DNA-binding GntR family transcriptional regulator